MAHKPVLGGVTPPPEMVVVTSVTTHKQLREGLLADEALMAESPALKELCQNTRDDERRVLRVWAGGTEHLFDIDESSGRIFESLMQKAAAAQKK